MMKPTINVTLEKNGKGHLSCKNDAEISNIHNYFYTIEKIFRHGKFEHQHVHQVTPSGSFYIGLFYKIYRDFQKIYSFNISAEFKKALKPDTRLDLRSVSDISGFTYHYYQKEAIQEMMKTGRGIIELGTAGGKSLICAGFAQSILNQQPNKKILIVAPGISLVSQLFADFTEKYKISDVTILTSTRIDEYDYSKNIIITNSECFINQIKNKQYLNLLDVDYVIVDECHRINDRTWISNIFKKVKTPMRFGLTGSMPDIGVNYYNIIGKIGSVIYSKNAKSLRKENFVAQLKIIMFVLEHKTKPVYVKIPQTGIEYYNMEKEWIINNPDRNKFIGQITKSFENNALILVDQIEYGNILISMLEAIGKKCVFIRGSTEVKDREMIQKQMESSNDMVVVAMDRIFSTGINVNNIHHIIFAFIGKAKIKIIQSIGRGLRKNHNKHHVTVYDISDKLPCSLKHFAIRKRIFEKEVDDVKIKQYKI